MHCFKSATVQRCMKLNKPMQFYYQSC